MARKKKRKSKNTRTMKVGVWGSTMNYNDGNLTNWGHHIVAAHSFPHFAVNHWVGNAPGTLNHFIESTENLMVKMLLLKIEQGTDCEEIVFAWDTYASRHTTPKKQFSLHHFTPKSKIERDGDQIRFFFIDILKEDLIKLNNCPSSVIKTEEDATTLENRKQQLKGAITVFQNQLNNPHQKELSKLLD